jgi:hypothetical protein
LFYAEHTTASAMSGNKIRPQSTLLDLSKKAGILNLSPSDLVFESNSVGFSYYDFVLSLSRRANGFEIYLAKLDSHTNLEWFETIKCPMSTLTENQLPSDELSLITLGVLTWRHQLAKSKLLCLVGNMSGPDNTVALEGLKRACYKFGCIHHVMAINQRRSTLVGSGAIPESKAQESMKLRLLTCQSRTEIELSAQAIREGRYLLTNSGNPLLCFCFFPLS